METSPATPAELLSRIDNGRRPRPALDTAFVPTSNATEKTLAKIWTDVLGLNEVGAEDNFFALGGDSLHMTQIASRLRKSFSIELSFSDFFDYLTIADLARLLRQRSNAELTVAHDVTSALRYLPAVAVAEPATASDVDRYRLPRLGEEGAPQQIGAVVIPTCGRPVALERCLVELFENLNRYGHAPRVLVADGTQEGNVSEDNREAVRKALRGFDFDVFLIGATRKRNLSNRLIREGLSKEVVEFAFEGLPGVGQSCGANRNVLLLATAGQAFLSLDDDTECQFARSPAFRPTLETGSGRFGVGREPAGIWVYQDREHILSSVALSRIDLLDSHQQLLGRQVPQLASAVKAESRISVDDSARLEQSTGRVLVTVNGLIGDCGWGSPSQYLFLDDASFERLTSSEQSYSTGITSREMLRGAESFVISERIDNLMSTAFAVDNRSMLPPFVPVGRGSDVLFGQMLKHVEPLGRFGSLPWAILHAPIEKRRFSPGEVLRDAATTDFKGMFTALTSRMSSGVAATGEDALQQTGQLLIDTGDLPIEGFCALLIDVRQRSVEGRIGILEDRIGRANGSKTSWNRDSIAYLETLKKSRNQLTAAIPAELLYGREIEDAALLARTAVSLYGRLLCSWPAITHALRGLNNEMFEDG